MHAGCGGDRRAQSVGRGDDGRCSQAADGLGRGHRGNTCAGERGSGSGGEPRAGDDARPWVGGRGGPRPESQRSPANILEELTGVLLAESPAEVPILAGSFAMGSAGQKGRRWASARADEGSAGPSLPGHHPMMGQQPRRGIEELEGCRRTGRTIGVAKGTSSSEEETGSGQRGGNGGQPRGAGAGSDTGRRTEVRVLHGVPGSESCLVVVAQQLVQEIERLGAHEVLVLTVDEALPPLPRVSARRRKRRRRRELHQPRTLPMARRAHLPRCPLPQPSLENSTSQRESRHGAGPFLSPPSPNHGEGGFGRAPTCRGCR